MHTFTTSTGYCVSYDCSKMSYEQLLEELRKFESKELHTELGIEYSPDNDLLSTLGITINDAGQKRLLEKCIEIAEQCNDDSFKITVRDLVDSSPFFYDNDKEWLKLLCECKHLESQHITLNWEQHEELLLSLCHYRALRKDKLHILDFIHANCDLYSLLNDFANKHIPRNGIGRPRGVGKQKFEYNGKQYSTIQECADDYNISKQAMYKRLKKLDII